MLDAIKTPWRDDKGRYIEHDRWERVCKCGHTLGEHTAAKVAGKRDCTACMCDAFVLDRKAVR